MPERGLHLEVSPSASRFTRRARSRRLAVGLAVALVVGWPASSRAEETPSSAEAAGRRDPALLVTLSSVPGHVLHETYRDGNWELVERRADGKGELNLTRTPDVHELYPQATRDGRRIAFVADREVDGKRVRGVEWMRRDGSERRTVAAEGRQPAWSPDGKTLLYLPPEFSRYDVTDYVTKGLRFHDVETGETREHPNPNLHHLYNPVWSADGRWILATVHGGMGHGHAILAIEAAGDGVVDLKIGGCRPDISRDGTRIAWGLDDHTVAIASLDLSDRPQVRGERKLVVDAQHLYHADWSPDGRHIVFSRGPGGRVPADGPGTSRGLAEFVGVRAKWDLCVVDVETGVWCEITNDGASNKEGEWILPPSKEDGKVADEGRAG